VLGPIRRPNREPDQLLDTFDPQTRKDLQAVIARSDEVFAGSGAKSYNRMLDEAPTRARPGVELTGDPPRSRRPAQAHLDADMASTALAQKSPELQSAVDSSARC